MKVIHLTLLLFPLVAIHCQGQEIISLTVTPVSGELVGTTVANLKGSLPSAGEHILEDSADLTTWTRVSPFLKPANGLLNWNLLSGPMWEREGIQHPQISVRGSTTWYTSRFYRLRAIPAADAAPQRTPVAPCGRLWRPDPTGPFYMTTRANWRIFVNGVTIIITSPDLKTKWECWGDGAHENLNGKHIKDWESRRRTILLPGDTTVTLTSGEQTPGTGLFTIRTVHIYDSDQTHKLNTHNNTVEMSVLLSRVGEAVESDGETMRIWHLGGGRYYAENIYFQDDTGAAATPQKAVPLGSSGGEANPTQVNDYYDDPRLGHT